MLLGRDRELADIMEALARLPSAGGSMFLLAGEPGIGKTRLATQAAIVARERGVRVAWGRCWEAGGAPAFWPWREAFETLGARFPDAGAIAAAAPAEARFALFREAEGTLARVASHAPVLILLEDLHAADSSTLLLLEFVARQLRKTPIAIIATYRDLEARLRAETTESIARLGRVGRVMQLARLRAEDVAALVRDAIDGADEGLLATVVEATGGNPLFVHEVVRDIRAHGQRSGLPLGVRQVIRERLAPLSLEVRRVLEAAAVLGVELSRAALLRLLENATALQAAVDHDVLVPSGERLRFSHALYREALYYDLDPRRRQSLHREAAQELAATGASRFELAHHWLEAGPEAIAPAVEHAIRAAAHAVDTFAFEDALALLERVRAAIPSGSQEAALRCRVLSALGETKLRSGDAAGRASCLEAASAARTLGDPELLAQAALAYGAVFVTGGVDPVLVGLLEEALGGLPDADSPLRARLMARLAAARQPSPPSARQRDVDLGLAAIAMARRVASRSELLGVIHAASGVLYGLVDPAVRLLISREQEALAEELGDTTRLLHARVRLALDHLELGDFAAYAELATAYAALAASVGPVAAPWRVALMRSLLAMLGDDFDASERWQEQAGRIDPDDPRARRARAFHRIGFLRAAERHAELRAAIPELRGLWLAMPYGAVLADAHVASVLSRIGDDDALRDVWARLPQEAVGEAINAPALADAMWATGDRALAARLEPLLDFFAERWRMYWFDCEIADSPNTRARAYLSAILGRWEEADRLFARALSVVEAAGRRSLAARMRFELGDLLLRLGHDVDRARHLVSEGRRQAGAMGFTELVALIERRHPELDSDSRPRAAPSTRPAFSMSREGEYFAVTGTHGTLRFKASRGMQYLAALALRPNVEIHVLELVGSSDHADRGDAGDLADASALRAYRARLEALKDALERAEALGDLERAERARGEMEGIAAELSRSTQKGGRPRHANSAVDRARSAVQRRIKDALDRVAEQDPPLGAWLRRSVRTGNYCSFLPTL